jgi:hypothetical protein
MSLLSATPSTRDRTTPQARRPELPRHGAPRLWLVPDHDRPMRAAGHHAARQSTALGNPNGPIRLTRRGRIVLRIGTAVLVLLAVASGVLLLERTAQAGSQSHPVPVSYRIVLPGETLWQIAGEVAPKADRRDTVAEIMELNALDSAAVGAGQRIAVPVTGSP